MSFAAVIDALGIPREALVEQRVPKKLLLDNGAPTAADKRQIQDEIEELTWVAALKPINIGVPAFQDAVRQYLEVAILTVTLRATAKPLRLIELIHRAVPYPLVLVARQGEAVSLSVAHKRWSLGETGKVVVDEILISRLINTEGPVPSAPQLLDSLTLSKLPRHDLFALYQGLHEALDAFKAAQITGVFSPTEGSERAEERREALNAHADLQRRIAVLRGQATNAVQLNRRVELNLSIKRLQVELQSAIDRLR